ncbi:TPA: 50S ribosomal protein L35 [Patescibacteria group bacterium]|uniref:Large ribosomal subunit protein bL35 n=1 Tax=Candidatus Gottesmanbacteria bacterium GW2011_GWA1_43_11 TaxID=1618436 RepID=A0A0G1CF81_9BACT|nr:MAG: ribosomal protein L35 [Candidatus Gottesmanbacteria bacterium GW2011_GWA1_43_11]HCS78184.1 50S ribosomal protein L35 [Patescibacteria group bacterium]
MKAKTNKIASKRFKITKTGKILRARQNSRHLRHNKSKSQKRGFKKGAQVSNSFTAGIKHQLPYA